MTEAAKETYSEHNDIPPQSSAASSGLPEAAPKPTLTPVTPHLQEPLNPLMAGEAVYMALQEQCEANGLDLHEATSKEWVTIVGTICTLIHKQVVADYGEEAKRAEIIILPEGPIQERANRYREEIQRQPYKASELRKSGLKFYYDNKDGRIIQALPEIQYAYALLERLYAEDLESAGEMACDVLTIYGECIDSLHKAAYQSKHRQAIAEKIAERRNLRNL